MNEDLFAKMEKTKVVTKKSTSTRVSELKFVINEDDNELLSLVKTLVNQSNLVYSDVYAKYGKNLGWNMINGIKNNQISWDRFIKWMDLLEQDVEIILTPKNK